MGKRIIVILVLMLSIIMFAVQAQAVIVDMGNNTRDTSTALDWLDFSNTLNRSYDDVSSQFGIGGDFEGYRYGTSAEVTQLWTNFGITDIGVTPSIANFTPVTQFHTLFGSTGTSGGYPKSQGMVIELYGGNRATAGTGFTTNFPGSNDELGGWAEVPNSSQEDATPSLWGASYLVTAVPEPSTYALFGIGLIGLIGAGLRRAKEKRDVNG
ncbi:MAG: PEP-CTERM sorting domain-containing protein [Candidatus Ancaeobacter aquaticus]|nr:PEP-CTERM sorting domain-containing protein [Candidatus Ancaeobacter aquaticus]